MNYIKLLLPIFLCSDMSSAHAAQSTIVLADKTSQVESKCDAAQQQAQATTQVQQLAFNTGARIQAAIRSVSDPIKEQFMKTLFRTADQNSYFAQQNMSTMNEVFEKACEVFDKNLEKFNKKSGWNYDEPSLIETINPQDYHYELQARLVPEMLQELPTFEGSSENIRYQDMQYLNVMRDVMGFIINVHKANPSQKDEALGTIIVTHMQAVKATAHTLIDSKELKEKAELKLGEGTAWLHKKQDLFIEKVFKLSRIGSEISRLLTNWTDRIFIDESTYHELKQSLTQEQAQLLATMAKNFINTQVWKPDSVKNHAMTQKDNGSWQRPDDIICDNNFVPEFQKLRALLVHQLPSQVLTCRSYVILAHVVHNLDVHRYFLHWAGATEVKCFLYNNLFHNHPLVSYWRATAIFFKDQFLGYCYCQDRTSEELLDKKTTGQLWALSKIINIVDKHLTALSTKVQGSSHWRHAVSIFSWKNQSYRDIVRDIADNIKGKIPHNCSAQEVAEINHLCDSFINNQPSAIEYFDTRLRDYGIKWTIESTQKLYKSALGSLASLGVLVYAIYQLKTGIKTCIQKIGERAHA